MTVRQWWGGAEQLHDRVVEACWESLAAAIAQLHRPHLDDDGLPVCHGCDRDGPTVQDAVWPCRTYTLIASTVLGVSNIEDLLVRLTAKIK